MSAEKDIAFQAPVEMKIAWALAQKQNGMILPNKAGKDCHKDFQLFIPFLIEVKCDYKSKATRNLYFEVHNCYRNKPSGLTATKAWRWIHYTPGDAVAYVYNPKTMLQWLQNQKDFTLVKGNGDNNSDGYIVPISTISKLDFVKTMDVML